MLSTEEQGKATENNLAETKHIYDIIPLLLLETNVFGGRTMSCHVMFIAPNKGSC